jgi:hypothetical protein
MALVAAAASFYTAFLVLNLVVAVRLPPRTAWLPRRQGALPPAPRWTHLELALRLFIIEAYLSTVVCAAVPVFDQVSSRMEWPRDHAATSVAIV